MRCAVLLWLAVAQVVPGGTGAKRGVGEVAVRVGVGFQTEVWEVDEHPPEVLVTKETTAWLLGMGTQTVEWGV